jgi:hypothetical protein
VRLTQLIDSVNKPARAQNSEGERGGSDGEGADEDHVVDEGDPSPGER